MLLRNCKTLHPEDCPWVENLNKHKQTAQYKKLYHINHYLSLFVLFHYVK